MRIAHPDQTPPTGAGFNPYSWAFPAAILLILIVLGAFGEEARLALRFDREALSAGEWWRLVSGHFVHLGWAHLGMNGAGLVLVWLLTGSRLSVPQWLAVLAATVAGIDVAFWWLSPGLDWYVGLSGVLHGLLFAGLAAGVRRATLESLLIGLVVAAKIAFEQIAGPLPGSEASAGGPVVVDAHLYGSIAGLMAAVPFMIRVSARRAI